MDIKMLSIALLAVAFLSIVIMYVCASFDTAASYLGRNMSPGIKGATINAIGSSMPELLTTMAFLFLFQDVGGFSAGVATAAGSAIFNGLIIPALCILVVMTRGVNNPDGTRTVVTKIVVGRHTIARDGFWLLFGEVLLIYFLGSHILTWVVGASLMLLYVGYFIHLMIDNKRMAVNKDNDEEEEDVPDVEVNKGLLHALLTFDFHHLFFQSKALNDFRAWVVLIVAILILSIACYGLAEAVVIASEAMHIPVYFTAVVLAAAATSVPDTFLSLQDAVRGDYDDAISNAVGSNIFDIAVSLGLPLLIYTLIYGSIDMNLANPEASEEVQSLRIVLLGISAVMIGLLYARARNIGKETAYILLALYFGWLTWVVGQAFHWF